MTQPKMTVHDQPSDKVIAKLGGWSIVELDGVEYVHFLGGTIIPRVVLDIIVATARRLR